MVGLQGFQAQKGFMEFGGLGVQDFLCFTGVGLCGLKVRGVVQRCDAFLELCEAIMT